MVDRAGCPKNGTNGPLSSLRSARKHGQAPFLMARKRTRAATGVLGRQTRLVERNAHAVQQGFDMRVGHALINADEGNAKSLAAVRQNLPVSQVKSAHNERFRAARCFVETFRRLEDNAVALGERFNVKALSEGSPKIFPHRGRDRLALTRRFFGVREFEIRERALLSPKARGDEAPDVSGEPRSCLHRHGAREDDCQPQRGKFQAKTQPFWELHETVGDLERTATPAPRGIPYCIPVFFATASDFSRWIAPGA